MTGTLPEASASSTAPPAWWRRPGLESRDGRLTICGEDAEALARQHGTPLFVYDRARYAENARHLQDAATRAGVPFRLRFALKANPLPEVLEVFRGLGTPGSSDSVGIDACSPGEIVRALECGWHADEISYTGTNVSDRDFDVIVAQGIHVNLDAISQVERYGRRAPGSRVGLRIDPGAGAGYLEHLEYSGDRPSKFGIGLERFDDALAACARHDLKVDTIHFHAGSGWLADGLAGFERALPAAVEAVERARAAGHDVIEVNVGGGLGRPARSDERPVDLAAYVAALQRHLGPLGVTIACEPGDYLSKDAGILLGEVVTIEQRRGSRSSASTSGGTSTAGTSSTSSSRSSCSAAMPRRPGPRRSPWPATSTRRATSSPSTTRWRRSRRATSSRSSTPVATPRR